MNENSRKKIVYAALVIAVIWGLYNYEWPTSREKKDIAPETAPAAARTDPQEILSSEIINEKTNYNWGADPFRIYFGKRVNRQGGNWVVTGILYNTATPLAYINRTPLRIGDTIDNARVVDIERDYVVLNYKGNDHKIYFAEG